MTVDEYREHFQHDKEIGFITTRVSHSITQRFNRLFDQYGITYPQSRVLGHLITSEGLHDVNQRDLERALGIKASSISSLVRNLENKGFIMCQRRTRDARNKSIFLTEKGRDITKGMDEVILSSELELIDGMSEEEVEQLRSLLTRVTENIEKHDMRKPPDLEEPKK